MSSRLTFRRLKIEVNVGAEVEFQGGIEVDNEADAAGSFVIELEDDVEVIYGG